MATDDRVSGCGGSPRASISCGRSALLLAYQRLPASTWPCNPQLQQSWLCCVLCLIERMKQQGELDNSVACSALAATRPHWILLSCKKILVSTGYITSEATMCVPRETILRNHVQMGLRLCYTSKRVMTSEVSLSAGSRWRA